MYFVKKCHLLMPLLFLFTVFSLQAQRETATDSTLIQILQLKESAKTSTINQEFSDAFIDLNKAYRISVLTKKDSIKYDIKLSIAKLHFYIHNFDKANIEGVSIPKTFEANVCSFLPNTMAYEPPAFINSTF